jgi:hypothetical protein
MTLYRRRCSLARVVGRRRWSAVPAAPITKIQGGLEKETVEKAPCSERSVEAFERPEQTQLAATVAPAVVGQRRPKLIVVDCELRRDERWW